MPNLSAGILLYKTEKEKLEVLLVHPGGPFWAKKDVGAWSLPKGEYDVNEDPWHAAQREFKEETGQILPSGKPVLLGEVVYSNKKVIIWAQRGMIDAENIKSNRFMLEWPPKSGKNQEFAEIDRAAWFDIAAAKQKLIPGQVPFLDKLQTFLNIK